MAATQIKDGFNGGSDNQLKVNADGSINVNGGGGGGSNASVGPTGATAPTSATEIGGVDRVTGKLISVAVDALGRIQTDTTIPGDVNALTLEQGTVDTSFGEVSAVVNNVVTTVTSYVAGGPTRMKFVEVSGTNIATYSVLVNGSPINRKNTFYGYLDTAFQFSKGYPLTLGDVVTVTVVQDRPSLGAYTAFILFLKDYP